MDLDPFELVGINSQTMRFLDVFLLHCLTSASPDDTPQEIAAVGRNQHAVAERGREPGLQLERAGVPVALTAWGQELLDGMAPIAQALDAAHGTDAYSRAVQSAQHALQHPDTLPSARVLRAITEDHGGSFVAFARAQSEQTRAAMLQPALAPEVAARFAAESQASWDAQRAIEAADTMPFDVYLKEYLAPHRLQARALKTA
jgi:glutamate--cysteine ligase